MAKDPLDRSSAATLLQHPFVASLTTPDEGTVPVESMISEIQSIGPALLHYRELEKLWNSDSFRPAILNVRDWSCWQPR